MRWKGMNHSSRQVFLIRGAVIRDVCRMTPSLVPDARRDGLDMIALRNGPNWLAICRREI
jgi:hypothetical protein